ncbi:L-aminoadipate-semialdehyde dehydrogenase [Mycena venus]|uniref:L-aminoadipate-semialdehyde dehydrogenase n=1 Tax=Mycena venus TaxID=2733690 RepID=A0A8H6YBY1_9AGAR|nr:L-aminoadipate-semialdehyde dehydrogenase [Mycena venus]
MSQPLVPRLPLELFINILTFLPRAYLSDVSTVSHLFHDLVSPLLFSTFRFHPGVQIEISESGTRLRWELDRLEFWSSDAIAPLVRKSFISLYCTKITANPEDSSPVGTAVCEAISRFKNLRSLSCNFANRRVDLLALRVQGLAHLQRLEINAGRLSPPRNPTAAMTLSIAHFSYTEMPELVVSNSPYLTMLDPARLYSLELSPFHPRALDNFLGDGSAIVMFHKLRTLRLTFRNTDFTRVHASIAHFPAVRELVVHINGSCLPDTIPTTPLVRHLESYKGPAVLLPLILAGSAPEELVVTQGSAAEVLEGLRTATHPDFVTSLSMGVKLHADIRQSTVLQDIFSLCPSLTRLALEVSSDGGRRSDDDGFGATTLAERLVEIILVHQGLETLVLRWRLGWEASLVPRRSELETILRRKIPVFRHVLFSGGPGISAS